VSAIVDNFGMAGEAFLVRAGPILYNSGDFLKIVSHLSDARSITDDHVVSCVRRNLHLFCPISRKTEKFFEPQNI
jgi:hypothetical protein